MDNISFTNLDTKTRIDIDLSKPITVVYGGNGTGKTTLSRTFQSEVSAVFNSDFINKNVYIVDSDGAKTDSGTKENISGIFLGEDAVDLAKLVARLKEEEKGYQRIRDEKITSINQELNGNSLNQYSNFDSLMNAVEYDFVFDGKKSFIENNKSFSIKKRLTTDILTDIDFVNSIKKLKSSNITKTLRNKIDEDSFIKEVLNNVVFTLDDILLDYNKLFDEINEVEKVFSVHGESAKVKKWISVGVELHDNKTECIFCSNPSIELNIKEWRKRLENNKIEIKNNLIVQIDKYVSSFDRILRESDLYKQVAPNIISSFWNINAYLDKVKTCILNNQFVHYEKIEILQDDIYKTEVKLVEDITNFIINKHLDSILFLLVLLKEFKLYIKAKEDESKEKNKEYANDIAVHINGYSKILGFNKDIRITLDNRGGQPKINLEADEKTGKLSNYSEGQRHKLALAIFFSMFEKNNDKIEIIVLDDPVISLDVFGYHSLKSLLKTLGKKYKDKKLVILTHNIHYLLIQISNFSENSEYINVFELTPNSINPIPTSILRLDDIGLFKVSINSISDLNDLTLKYWLCQKIFRNFLDLRLRFYGKASISNPSKDIEGLDNLSKEDKIKLQSLSNKICGTCRTKVVSVSEIKSLFINLNTSLEILGFPTIIDDNNFQTLEKFVVTDKTLEYPKPSSLIQEILHFAYNLEFIESPTSFDIELSNYLNHPRNQFTESLIAIKGKRDA